MNQWWGHAILIVLPKWINFDADKTRRSNILRILNKQTKKECNAWWLSFNLGKMTKCFEI